MGAQLISMLPIMIIYGIMVVPFYILFRRAGRSGWWALVGFVPLFGMLCVPWMLVLMRRHQPRVEDVFK